MPDWLKTTGAAIAAGGLAFLAILAAAAATRHRAEADKWKGIAVEEQERDVADSLGLAKEAKARARIAGKAAKAAELKTKEHVSAINAKEQTMASVTSSWRKPKSG